MPDSDTGHLGLHVVPCPLSGFERRRDVVKAPDAEIRIDAALVCHRFEGEVSQFARGRFEGDGDVHG